MRLPRFLWVPFELGRPFGAPHEPDFQRRVLRDALALVERTDGPVVLADFPDDAPTAENPDDEAVWACPISFAGRARDESDPVRAARRELGQLAPWAELGTPPAPNSGMSPGAIVDLLAATASGEQTSIEVLRLAADDIRTWYLHAASEQPGRATSHERNAWFWRDTALARLLGQVAARLLDDRNPTLRLFAERGLIPRDHFEVLVTSTQTTPGHTALDRTAPDPNGVPDD